MQFADSSAGRQRTVYTRALRLVVVATTVAAMSSTSWAAKVYFTSGPYIYRSNVDGSDQEVVHFHNFLSFWSIELEPAGQFRPERIYWSLLNFVRRQEAGANGIQELTDDYWAADLAIDVEGSMLYFTAKISMAAGAEGIYRVPLSPLGDPQMIVAAPLLSTLEGIALDVPSQKMYWADQFQNVIRRANLDGTGVEQVLSLPGPAGIDLDLVSGKIYWTDSSAGCSVRRSDLDGSNIQLVAPCTGPHAVDFDDVAGKVYWRNNDSIQRADGDGSNLELVTAGLEHPSTWLGGLTIDSRECGDDELDPGEECDDGNHVDDDGCDWDCQIPDPPGKCGDGELDPGEQCDDGNDVDDDGCDSDCQFGAIPVPASSPASVAILAAALMIAAATRVLRSRARR